MSQQKKTGYHSLTHQEEMLTNIQLFQDSWGSLEGLEYLRMKCSER